MSQAWDRTGATDGYLGLWEATPAHPLPQYPIDKPGGKGKAEEAKS